MTEEAQQGNQQAITQAHQQQVEQEQQQGEGDFVMRGVLPQPRPLLPDLRPQPLNLPLTIEDVPRFQPSIMLQPHRPNVGATQQPLPPTGQQLALPAPTPNVQVGGTSSSSSSNFQPHQAPQQEEQTPESTRRRLARKRNLKESAGEDKDLPREELNMRPLIMPKKIGIQKLRETFETANSKETINHTTHREYRSLYNQWVNNKGKPTAKKEAFRKLQKLDKKTVYDR